MRTPSRPACFVAACHGLLRSARGFWGILVAMLMVEAVGLGPLPGILAIAFHTTGMLAKFYAEAAHRVGDRCAGRLFGSSR